MPVISPFRSISYHSSRNDGVGDYILNPIENTNELVFDEASE